MSLHFEIKTSTTAQGLANGYLDFLRRDTDVRVGGWNEYTDAWAVVFDKLLKAYSPKAIRTVMDYYYRKAVSDNRVYIYTDPSSLMESFPILASQCRRRFNPLPKEDVEPLMKEFNKYRWDNDAEVLTATLGQSLLAVRRFKNVLEKSDLSKAKKDYLENQMGTNFSIIKKKLLPYDPPLWFRTYRLPRAITYRSLCEDAEVLLKAYGTDPESLRKFMDDLRRDRPRKEGCGRDS